MSKHYIVCLFLLDRMRRPHRILSGDIIEDQTSKGLAGSVAMFGEDERRSISGCKKDLGHQPTIALTVYAKHDVFKLELAIARKPIAFGPIIFNYSGYWHRDGSEKCIFPVFASMVMIRR